MSLWADSRAILPADIAEQPDPDCIEIVDYKRWFSLGAGRFNAELKNTISVYKRYNEG